MAIKRWFLFIFLNLLSFIGFSQCDPLFVQNLRKTAIVIGESKYVNIGTLKNPVNDALDISDSLRKIGFDVFTYADLGLRDLEYKIDSWLDSLEEYQVALFYFSGHGAEIDGENYLIPTDAKVPKAKADLKSSSICANSVLSRIEEKELKYTILILDACRSNPFVTYSEKKIGNSGLTAMSGSGSFIGFAASPGKIADDGKRRNGVYTEGLLKYLTVPTLTIDQLFTKVNYYVRESTNNSQVPYKNSSLSDDFCFNVLLKSDGLNNSSIELGQSNSGSIIIKNNKVLIGSRNKLLIRDLPSLNLINEIQLDNFNPEFISSSIFSDIYLYDTSRLWLMIFDSKEFVVKKYSLLNSYPTSRPVIGDNGRLYYGYSRNDSVGGIFFSDFFESEKKIIEFEYTPISVAINPNLKTIYCLTELKNGEKYFLIIDSKNMVSQNYMNVKLDDYRIVKKIKMPSGVNEIFLSNDKKNILFYNKPEDTKPFADLDISKNLFVDRNLNRLKDYTSSATITRLFLSVGNSIITFPDPENKLYKSKTYLFKTKPAGIVKKGNYLIVWEPEINKINVIDIISH